MTTARDSGRVVAVTGASGFLARPVIERLAVQGWRVRALTRSGAAPAWLQRQAQAGIHRLDGSDEAIAASLAGVDAVCHLAGRAHVLRETAADPAAEFRAANTVFTQRLAEAAGRAGVRRFVFVSTIGVHGSACTKGERWTEASPLRPATPYAESKLAAEDALRTCTALEHVILRPPLIHGAGAKGNFERLLGLVRRGLPLPFASVHNQRSFIGAAHLAALIATSLDHPAAANRTFVVADQEVFSTAELIRALAAALGRPARLLPAPAALLRAAGRMAGAARQVEQLIGDLEVDAGAIRAALRVPQTLAARDSLAEMAAAFRAADITAATLRSSS